MDSLNIGCTPANEPCEQMGPNYSPIRAKKECQALIHQLRRMFGEEPCGARLRIAACPHDFGTYHEVECRYNENEEAAIEYAFRCEAGLPENWDEAAKRELGIK